jgi:nucleoside-diphosphate-sugar epimerase
MRVLVVGGTGFLGRFVVRDLLADQHEVAVFHRGQTDERLSGEVESIRGDRRDFAAFAPLLRDFAPEVVIDLILSSGYQAEQLMSVFRGVSKRVIVISSMDVYRAAGILHGTESGTLEPIPLTEGSALRTNLHPYPVESLKSLQTIFDWLDDDYDKVPVENVVQSFPELPATVLRLPMMYGPGDKLHRVLPLVKRMDEGRPFIVMQESLAQWRSCRGYVEDIAEAILLALNLGKAAGRVYNVAEEVSYSELEWAGLIAKSAAWNGELIIVPDEEVPSSMLVVGNLNQHWVADTSRIRKELGYRERIPRGEAIRRTVEWERSCYSPREGVLSGYEVEEQAAASLRARRIRLQ